MENFREDDTDKVLTRRRPCACGKSQCKSPLSLPNLLCYSFVFNIVFVVLFLVVFIQLNNVQTRLAKLESPLSDEPSELPDKSAGLFLKGNSTVPPITVSTENATATPILIKVRANCHW